MIKWASWGEIKKSGNPNHDAHGQFASSSESGSGGEKPAGAKAKPFNQDNANHLHQAASEALKSGLKDMMTSGQTMGGVHYTGTLPGAAKFGDEQVRLTRGQGGWVAIHNGLQSRGASAKEAVAGIKEHLSAMKAGYAAHEKGQADKHGSKG